MNFEVVSRGGVEFVGLFQFESTDFHNFEDGFSMLSLDELDVHVSNFDCELKIITFVYEVEY